MPRRMPAKYKQLQFETAIRNPERYKGLLAVVYEYEGQKLDDSCLLDIMCKIWIKKVVSRIDEEIDENISYKLLKNEIIQKYKTRKADGGYPSGYQSRFWSYMRTPSELGLVYAQYDEPLKISKMAKSLIKNEINDQEAFSIQTLFYNRKSPYKNVSNDFNYFKFILNVLLKLNDLDKKLKYTDFIISMYSRNGNTEEYLNEIVSNNITKDSILDYLKNNYNENKRPQTVLRDYPDAVLRILRIMGFITISSHGGEIYIAINKNNIEYINDLLKIDINCPEDAKMSAIDYYNRSDYYFEHLINFIKAHRDTDSIDEGFYKSKLEEIISKYNINEKTICHLLNLLFTNTRGEYPIIDFKYIPEPLKLEFYITILLHLKFKNNMLIKPNYKVDDLGIPISHAPGNMGDIEVFNKYLYWLVEVTLIRSKIQQYNNETTSVIRHINQVKTNNDIEKYLSFVAPYVHSDTTEFYEFSIYQSRIKGEKLYLKPYILNEFIDKLNSDIFEDMKEYTNSTIRSIKNISL